MNVLRAKKKRKKSKIKYSFNYIRKKSNNNKVILYNGKLVEFNILRH